MSFIWVGGSKDRQIQETLSWGCEGSLGLGLSTEIINSYLALRSTWVYSIANPCLKRSLDSSCLGPSPFPTQIQNRLLPFSCSNLSATGTFEFYLHAWTVTIVKFTSYGTPGLKTLLLKRIICKLRVQAASLKMYQNHNVNWTRFLRDLRAHFNFLFYTKNFHLYC